MTTKHETSAISTVRKDQQQDESLEKKFSPVFVEAEKMFERLADITTETAKEAYAYFLERGGELGKDLDDWISAESRVLRPVAVEIKESDDVINVSAAVPGFKPEEIEISVEDDRLILTGETEQQQERKDENVVYSEWKSNRFFRQLTLPSAVNAENVTAEVKDGVLNVVLPKAAAQLPKRIAVKAG